MSTSRLILVVLVAVFVPLVLALVVVRHSHGTHHRPHSILVQCPPYDQCTPTADWNNPRCSRCY